MAARIALRNVPTYWAKREAFQCNKSLRGQAWTDGSGQLPAAYAEAFHAMRESIAFVVYSYATPIAWVLTDGTEIRPAVKYSVTTSRHQGRLYRPFGI